MDGLFWGGSAEPLWGHGKLCETPCVQFDHGHTSAPLVDRVMARTLEYDSRPSRICSAMSDVIKHRCSLHEPLEHHEVVVCRAASVPHSAAISH